MNRLYTKIKNFILIAVLLCGTSGLMAQYTVISSYGSSWTLQSNECGTTTSVSCIESWDYSPPVGHNYYYSNGYYYPNNASYQTGSGVPINCDPCYQSGGDSDGDGVCDNQDCQPNNPAFPATPGSSCNDGNSNTINDVVTSDGCSCEGSACTVDIASQPQDQLFCAGNSPTFCVTATGAGLSYQWEYSWNGSTSYGNATESGNTTNCMSGFGSAAVGAYFRVRVTDATECVEYSDWARLIQGDADGDGTCDNEDCQPNDPAYPTIPGTSCNDNNANTQNDIIQADGCTCTGTNGSGPIGNINVTVQSDQSVCPGETVSLTATYNGETTCESPCSLNSTQNDQVIAKWDLEECYSFAYNNSNFDYSEMTSAVTGLPCASVTTSALYRLEGKHSCTDDAINGDPGDAVCLGIPINNSFVDNHPQALRFDITIDPNNGNSGITKLNFREFAPSTYIWSQAGYDDNTGPNNYPTKYGIRILKDGVEVFKEIDLNTSTNGWSLRSFDLSNNINFQSNQIALYQVELLAYGQIGNGAEMSVWDIDHIKLYGACCTPQSNNNVSYLWSNGETTANISVQTNQTKTYTVTVTDCSGDTNSDSATITVKDADNDSICDDDDCAPNDSSLPTTPGSSCNDNNSNTQNDIIQADGCTCLGTEIVVPNIGISDITVNEEDGTATLEICLDQTTAIPVYLNYATANASAISGIDYTSENGLVTIQAGETCVELVFDIIDDSTPEDIENFVVNLTNSTNGNISDPQGTVTIIDSDPVIPNIGINDITVNEEDGTATLEICLDQTTTVPVSVDYATTNGSATNGSDYTANNSSVTIPAGQTCVEVTFDIIEDNAPEDTENFVVNLTNPENGNVTDPQGTVTITDSDVIIPNIGVNDITVNEEDGTATLEICLDQTTTVPVSVSYNSNNASAISESDYTANNGSITIPAGQTCVEITFNIIDDANPEDTEIFEVTITNPTNGNIDDPQGTVTIIDSDPVIPNIGISDITVNEEDGTATLEICLDQTTTVPVSVNYNSINASAISGSDYTANNGSVTIPAGQTCVELVFDITDDTNPEDTETFVVNLTNPTNGNISDPEGTVTINDTDVIIPNIGINDVTVNEEEGTTTLEICLDQTTTVPVTVDYNTNDASANNGTDYTAENGSVTIPAGQTCTEITLDITDDNTPEDTETFVVNLTNPENGNITDPQGTVTINDTDVVIPNIGINDVTVNEEDGIATLEICLDQTTTVPVTVDYATANASAINNADYIPNNNSVIILAGQTCVEVTFGIIEDGTPEDDENFVVNLTNPTNGNISDPQGTVTITDSDVVIPNIGINDVTVNEEEGTATLEICLDQTTTVPVTLDYASVNASAMNGVDYTSNNNTVTIPAGQTCVEVTFNITDDSNPEDTETFVVNLTNSENGNISDPQGTVTIIDSDVIIPNIGINDITVNEEDGTATLEICLDQTTTVPVTLQYATANASAMNGVDYTISDGTIIIVAGETCVELTFAITDDSTPEDVENFVVNLTNATNGNISDPQGTVTILDSDVVIPNIGINDVTVNEEAGTATLEICLDQTTTVPVSLNYATANASAMIGVDYTISDGMVMIPAGETCVEVTFAITDDSTPEDVENFVVNLTNATNGNISDPQGTVTILDSDLVIPNIGINDVTVNEEDGTATLEICLDQTTTVPVTLQYATANASAISGSDYTTNNGSVTIPAGQTCMEVSFDIIENSTPEDVENFVVNLTNATNGNISDPQGTVTIIDSDVIIPNIEINDITVNEEDGTATLEICLDQVTTVPVTLNYATADASAINGVDYTINDGMVTIPAGQTCAELTFNITDDSNPEDTETFVVNLTNPTNGNIGDPTGTITIIDSDPVIPNIGINDITVNEEDGTATLEICLDQSTTVPVTLNYATANASAISGIDYTSENGSVTIQAGETCIDVVFDIIEDATPEDVENFVVNLTNPTNGNISDPQGTVTITDSDVVIPNIGINDITVNEEDGTATLEICLDQTTTVPVTLNYATANASAIVGTDYTMNNGTVTIPAGETCTQVTFDITDDSTPEETENFVVNLTNPDNGNITDSEGIVTILDSDPAIPNIEINDITVNEEDGTATLEICLDQTTTLPVTLNYATANASAISGVDYTSENGSVTIPAGETCVDLVFDILEDSTPEDIENFVVNLTNATNGNISDPQGTVTIIDSDVTIPNIGINDITVNEEDGTATLEICLDQTTTVPVTLDYATANASAMNGVDYTTNDGSVTIPAGQTCSTVTFDITDDSTPEDTENFVVNLTNPENGNIADPEGVVTILDSDVLIPNISINDITVNEEDGTATLEICLNQTTTVPVSVNYATANASATLGSDYASNSGTVTIPAGQTCANVTFDITDDSDPENTENFVVNLTNANNGNIADPEGIVTILDSDLIIPSIVINDITVNEEDGTATLEICLDQMTTVPVTVDYATANASAIVGTDYVANSGSLIIPAGETCAQITFDITDDSNPEDTENFVVNLTNPDNGNISDPQGTVTILDTDPTIPGILINDITVNEEDETATLEICLDQTTTVPVTVDYATANASAMAGIDYTSNNGTVTIPAGQTCMSVTFNITDDSNPEDTENFVVNLTNSNNGNINDQQGTVTILDSDPIIPNIVINDVTVNEEDGTATLEICLDQTTTVPVTVNYATANASAMAGIDYASNNGSVTIPAGQTCMNVTFDILEDSTPEDIENFVVNLTNPTNGNISDPQGTVTITDSDVIIPNIGINDITVNEEDGTATLEICLDQTTTVPVTLDYTTADASAINSIDYTSNNGSVTIPAGQTCMSVTFAILEDSTPEDTENFVVNLTNPTNGNISDPQGTVTIIDSDPVIPNIVINDVTVNEEDGTATLEICLDQATTVPVSLDYATANASAMSGMDYASQNGSATIQAGETCVNLVFDIIEDSTPEDIENFVVNLTNPTNGNISDPQGTVTITDSDVIIPNIVINDITVNEEDGTATLEICLDQITTLPVILGYATANASAVNGVDYTINDGTVIIPAGQTCAQVTFEITDDSNPEDIENFVVNLTNPINGNISDPQGTVTILDSDPVIPNIVINDITVNEEDGTATLEICLDQATTVPVTLNYATANASAINGTDYTANNGNLTIPAGETCANVTFNILEDSTPEDVENFVVNLTNATNGNISDAQGTVTITDSDVIIPNIVINDITVNEENGTATLEICLDQTTTVPVTLDYATANASAINGVDYTTNDGTVIIPAGESCAQVIFNITDDSTPEDTEIFVVNLTNPNNGNISDPQGTVTILDTDVVIPNIVINDITVNEEDGTATLQICLDQITTVPVTVNYATSNAAAIQGSDYTASNGQVTIPAGQTCVNVPFNIIDDETPEDTEPFFVNLSNPVNGTIQDPNGLVTILDTDEAPPVVPNISINDITVNEEDGIATLHICIDQVTSQNVTVNYATSNAAAIQGVDYTASNGQVTIPAGQTCVDVTFNIIDDETPEDTEPFFVNLSNPVNGTIQDPNGLVTILDTDVAPPVVPNISINDITVNEEDGTATLHICVDQVTSQNITLNYATSNATAIQGTDYTANNGQIAIPAGYTCIEIPFNIIDDETPEDTETFTVTLSNPTNGVISDPNGTVTILDTDVAPPVVPNISINDITVNEEDGTATLQICIDQVTSQDVTVNYATSNAVAIQGSDYTASNGQLTIPAGQTCVNVPFNIIDDETPEDTETFTVTLNNPTNGVISNSNGTVTILDTDETPCNLTVTLGDDLMVCSANNLALTALTEGAATCIPQNCNTMTLVTYNGACDDPTDCLLPSGIASCLSNVSGVCPTNDSGPHASCNNNIICIASMFNDWDFSVTAENAFEFQQIEADFWYPTDGSDAGGTANESSCPTSYNAIVKFYIDGVLHSEKSVNVVENQIITKTVSPDAPILVEAGSTLKIIIDGQPISEDCDLFELAGLRINGCCSPQSTPMENNTYLWSGPGVDGDQTATVFTNSEGTYCVTVTDCGGCVKSDCINIASGSLTSGISTLNNPSSINTANGALLATASNGTGPYSFAWSNNGTGASISNLTTGEYTVSITDANGCTSTSTTTLNAHAIIGNKVWLDANQNGLQDSGEAGLQDVVVHINGMQNNGNVYTNTTTSATDGTYFFDQLDPGNYNLSFDLPVDYIATSPLMGNNVEIDSDADPITGSTSDITIDWNDNIEHIDAGFYINCNNLNPSFEIQEPICVNTPAMFSAISLGANVSYSWYFFNGPTINSTYISSQLGQTADITFTSSGSKLIRLHVEWNGCEADFDQIVTVLGETDPACTNCENIVEGGQIGTNQSGCSPFNPSEITNTTAPSGGNGTIQYQWAASIVGNVPQGQNDPSWTIIPNANQISYMPGTITQTTYYVRFSKRASCEDWTGISNLVKKEVLGDDISAEFEVINDPICSGSVIELAAFDIGPNAEYDWYFFNGPSTNSTYMGNRNGQEAGFIFSSGGEKLIRLSVVNSSGCSAIIDQVVTVLPETHSSCSEGFVQNTFNLQLELNSEDEVVLDWGVNHEPEGAVYEIEHSTDGTNFEIIGSATSGGIKEGSATTYTHTDDMPLFGMNFYRIKQITNNGMHQYSNVKDITIKFSDGNKGIVFPNPAIDISTLMFSSPIEETTQFEVTNAQGSIVKRFTMSAGMDKYTLNLSRWQAGYYFVYAIQGGQRQLVNKVLKSSN